MGKKLFYGAILLVVVIAGILVLNLPKPGKTGQFEWAMNVGKNYLDQGEAAKAVGVFEKAVETNPAHPDGRLNLANALLLNDQPDLALAQAREATLLDRNSSAAYFVAGCALNRLRRFEEAVQSLFLSINLDSSVAASYFQLGRAHLELAQFEEAVGDFEEVIRLEPEHASAHYQLSQALLRLNRQSESAEQLALHQKILAKLPQQSVSASTFERSKHTMARTPFTLEQPDLRGISVKFNDATAAMLGPDAAKLSGPVAVIDFNHDGRSSLFVREGDGFRLLVNTGGVLKAQGAAWPGVAGAGYRRCLVGDLNNDHFDDVVVLGEKASHLFRFATNGAATEITALAGLKDINLTGIDGALADLDCSGKLDLLVVTTNHTVQVLRNLGNSFFKDITTASGAPGSLADVEQVVVDDWNNDDTVDVVTGRAGGMPLLLTKVRGGLLTVTNAPNDWPTGSVIAVGDLNNDLRNDLVVAGKGGITCVLGHLNQRLTISTDERPISRIYLVDFDNDGWLDIVTCGIGVRLWRNCGSVGFQEYTVAAGLDKWGNLSVDSIAFADFDDDGDTDFIFCLQQGGLMFARNDGGNANHQLKVRMAGNRSNASGIGVHLTASAGGLRLSRTVTQVPMEIGLGKYPQADSVTTRWCDLLLSSIDVKAGPAPVTLVELQIPPGSCPYLYAWDGSQFRFLTDILCSAPLGLPVSESRLIEADPDEHFWIGGEAQFPPKDGHYILKITEELREVLYLDQAKLVAVDHPVGTVIVSTGKLLPGKPFAPHELVVLDSPQPIQRAVRSDGLDVTEALAKIDGQMVSPVRLRIPQLRGLAEPYSVTMDFGPLDTKTPLVLALTGWLRFGGGMANIAASHNPDLPYPFPTLDAETAEGDWQPVKVEVGAPAGKPKTIMVDLAGCLPAGTRRLKLRAAFEVHWDAAVMYQRTQSSRAETHELHADRADLQWRGFSDYEDLPWTQPLSPIHDQVQQTPKWSITPSGWCTRYGDVRELVRDKDEALVLLNGGDALTLSYASSDLPQKATGMVRDFFLFASGWDKDADVHVRHGQTVGPLPFHGMDDQRYGMEPRPVFSNDAWMKKYNTRWVGPQTLSRAGR